ncbi:DUF2169 family type VI secretion system accessory protein [Niveibacterium microcysteis]|uniref:DUF2169 domain-containing protein n=1 Tax=Niveibacterium microcysteis TaxID=2811415 RepID=A0ABX7M186_9RHOO|nr:DUF2169 domain-containing protein [Niveibacterium microcysteis]QSI75176.1 DUF2169 domain-containing protein [Niveibacterium microcysteis]
MEFRNLTPFDALCFASLDAQDTPHRTIVMRVGYRITLDAQGATVLTPMDEDAVPLCIQDECFEALNTSSPRQESDLAPYKPACDIIVIGSAHTPQDHPQPQVRVNCRIQRPDGAMPIPERPRGLNPLMAPSTEALDAWKDAKQRAQRTPKPGEVLLDKTLIVTGERSFRRLPWPLAPLGKLVQILSLGVMKPTPWRLTAPKPFTTLPLRYEYAWGGQSRINAGEAAAKRVPKNARLTPTQRAEHPDAQAPETQQAIAHDACEYNPLGHGAVSSWWLKATRTRSVPAPRIERPSARVSARDFWRHAQKPSATPPTACQPAGFGALARPWQPRRALAGTYDQHWLDTRHPNLPEDFDFGYWNCAPDDQQVPYLVGDEQLSFTNLSAADTPGVQRDQNGNSVLRCALPRHRAFVLTRWHDGLLLPLPMRIDTLIADLDAQRIDLVWRLVLPESLPIRVAETRYEVNPQAPLVRMAKPRTEERVHG